MKIELQLSKKEALEIVRKGVFDKLPPGVRITEVDWDRYGSSITVSATDEPESKEEA